MHSSWEPLSLRSHQSLIVSSSPDLPRSIKPAKVRHGHKNSGQLVACDFRLFACLPRLLPTSLTYISSLSRHDLLPPHYLSRIITNFLQWLLPTLTAHRVVVVGGFLTRNSTSYWGDIEHHFAQQGQSRKVIIAPVGACSSLHDRACEIFYSLKGGRVDYGAEHSKEHKHGQYGRKYSKGLYPEWSIDKPVHFVTHSLGGPTATKLIALLRAKFFGEEYHPDMVRSVFAVAAPFKGTPTVYLLGASYTGSHILRTFSLGNFLAKYIHISSFLNPLFSYNPEAWDFQPDSRNLGIFSLPNYSEPEEEEKKPSWSWSSLKQSVHTLWTQLRTSDWADSADSGSYDATFHAADARDRAGESVLNANTFYCSLMGTITTKESGSNHHRPDRSFRGDIFLYILAKMVGSFSYNLQPAPDFLFQTPAKPTSCSHPVAQARRLAIQTSLTSTESAPNAMLCRSPSSGSSTPSSAASSSGSSGWHSPTPSFSFERSSSESSQVSEESNNFVSSIQVAPATTPAVFGELSQAPRPSRRRPGHGHSRQTSVTDWYADWAAEWSPDQHVVPGAWDIRDAATAVPPTIPVQPPSDKVAIEDTEEKEEEKPVAKQLRDDLWENDGVVSVYSQTHPSECSDAHCRHHGDLDLSAVTCSARAHTTPQIGKLESGIWHVFKSRGMSHNCLVGGLARYDAERSAVWMKISEAMLDLDRARTMI